MRVGPTASPTQRLHQIYCETLRMGTREAKMTFRQTLGWIPAGAPPSACDQLVRHMTQYYGPRYVFSEIMRLEDGSLRQGLLNALIVEDTYYGTDFPTWYGKKAQRALIESEHVTARDLEHLMTYNPAMICPAVDRALLMIRKSPGDLVDLFRTILVLHDHKLKRKQKDRVISALIGGDMIRAQDMMLIVRKFPKYRRQAAAVLIDRAEGIEARDICLLLSYNDTSDIVEAAIQANNFGIG